MEVAVLIPHLKTARENQGYGAMKTDREADRHILVVEDQADLREGLCYSLRKQGYYVTGVADGREALARLRGAGPRPDLILLDLVMPNVDGWHFRDEQKQDPKLASIPVVVMSAINGMQQRSAPFLDAAGYIEKPVHYDEVLHAVAEALGKTASAAT